MLGYIFSDIEKITTKPVIVSGKLAVDLMNNPEFLHSWDNLYRNCEWATIFQSKEFVRSWYENNSDIFSPIIILCIEEDNIKSLLFLTAKTNGKPIKVNSSLEIKGAGLFDAEYQVWLSGSEDDGFLMNAIEALFEEYPNCHFSLRFIPAKNLINPLINNTQWKKHLVSVNHHRPLMDFKLTDEQKLFRKRHLKAKFNRINRVGKIELKEINDPDEFRAVLKEVLVHLDFRQAAMFNKIPSKKDPQRPYFLQSLFESGILHVTVLTLDGEIISSIIGVKDHQWIHLAGLISFSPFHAKHSPSLVHLFMLGQLMKDQGYMVFDLTPGDDGYKERISTSSDEVVEISISKNVKFKLKKSVKKIIHKSLLKLNVRPMSFELSLKKQKYLFKNKIVKKLQKPDRTADSQDITDIKAIVFKKNDLKELLLFNDPSGETQWEFLENASKLISEGLHFYTYSSQNILRCCIWFDQEEDQNLEIPTGSITPKIVQHYLHPSFKRYERVVLDNVTSILKNIP